MRNVTFISAGAGSGKTYSLTEKILEYIQRGGNADQIILTTFTNAAADELKEKVRSKLYEEGLYEAATRIDNAAIGTIHSIAYELILQYWYILGINPNSKIMGEEDCNFYISQSLAPLPSQEDIIFFNDLCVKFNISRWNNGISVSDPDFWMGDLRKIISQTTDLQIGDSDLEEACIRSKQFVKDIIKPQPHIRIDNNELLDALDEIILQIPNAPRLKVEQKIQAFVDIKSDFERKISSISKEIEVFPIAAYKSLSKQVQDNMTKGLAALCPSQVALFEELGDKALSDIRVYNALKLYIDKIFNLAKVWKREYAQFKEQRGLLDFNDVMDRFNQLMQDERVTTEILSRYKIALVDEFQDCSPLQVSFFAKLSEYMEHSYWVGDIKQAIYNFRGTNTALIESIIEEIQAKEDGNDLEILDKCWRSNTTIREMANTVFTNVFSDSLPSNRILLKEPDPGERKVPPKECELRHWHFMVSRADDRYWAMANEVQKLHREGVEYRNIALLYRNNIEAAKSAAQFKRLGIPYKVSADIASDELGERIGDLLLAIISVAASDDNNLSKAIIARNVESGYTAASIISDRLRYLDAQQSEDTHKTPWLGDLPTVKHLLELRNTIGNQSVSAAVETLIVEMNIEDLIKRIDPTASAYKYCSRLKDLALEYERQCYNLNMDCSMEGFAIYLRNHPISQSGDDIGVTITTYHKSKGLEWQCVILNSLDTAIDNKKIFYGVQTLSRSDKSVLTLIPAAISNYETAEVRSRIDGLEYYQELYLAAFEESKRLMYVGMTRPKELLVTTSAQVKSRKYETLWLDSITRQPMHATEFDGGYFEWHGLRICNHRLDYIQCDDDEECQPQRSFIALAAPQQIEKRSLRDIQPSKAPVSARLSSVEDMGSFADRITTPSASDALLGDCIHQLMCIYCGQADFASIAVDLAQQYGITIDSEALTRSISKFYGRMQEIYGAPDSVEREVPFAFERANGEVVHGEIDMVYRTQEGDVVVDYKTYQGQSANLVDLQSKFYAGKYSGQVEIYEEALRREGRAVRDRVICYISLGRMIRLRFNAEQ